jgi:hypothetical protein
MKRRQATLKGDDKVIGVDLVPVERDRRFEFIPKGYRYGFLGLKKTKEDLWKICLSAAGSTVSVLPALQGSVRKEVIFRVRRHLFLRLWVL